MDYLPIKSIDFTSAKSKKRKLDNLIESSSSNSSSNSCEETSELVVNKPLSCKEEEKSMLKMLSESGIKPAILSINS